MSKILSIIEIISYTCTLASYALLPFKEISLFSFPFTNTINYIQIYDVKKAIKFDHTHTKWQMYSDVFTA